MGVVQNSAVGHQVLLDGSGTEISAADLLNQVRHLLIAHTVNSNRANCRQQGLMDATAKYGESRRTEFTPAHPSLLLRQHCGCHVTKHEHAVFTLRYVLAVQLGGLDMEELLGLDDGALLVGGFEALRVGLAFKAETHLQIPTGISAKDAQLGGVVSCGDDGSGNGQGTVPWQEVVSLVCYPPHWKSPHTHKHFSTRVVGQAAMAGSRDPERKFY